MVTDASDTAVAVSLFRVKMSDVSTVTKTDLLDASKSQLIAMCYKKLHKSALNWHTVEAELHVIVLGCSNFGNFIASATAHCQLICGQLVGHGETSMGRCMGMYRYLMTLCAASVRVWQANQTCVGIGWGGESTCERGMCVCMV